MVGLPVSAMPTSGTATYNMYGGTAPTCTGPSCGAISIGSSLTVNFGSNSGSYSLVMANSGDGVNLSGGGGLSFSGGGVNFSGSGAMSAVSGSTAVNSAYGRVDGFLAGPAASHAGAGYTINYSALGAMTEVYGAAVYKRGAISATQPPP